MKWTGFSPRPEETAIRERVTYASYDVPFGDVKALGQAQHTKQPQAVPVRMRHGALEYFHIDLAVQAIANGGVLETAASAPGEFATAVQPAEVATAPGIGRMETRVTRGGKKR
jgi:hypothetical protein